MNLKTNKLCAMTQGTIGWLLTALLLLAPDQSQAYQEAAEIEEQGNYHAEEEWNGEAGERSGEEGSEESGEEADDDVEEESSKNPRVQRLQAAPFCGKKAMEWSYSKVFEAFEADFLLQDLDRKEVPLPNAFQTIRAVAELGRTDLLKPMFYSSKKWATAYAAKIVEIEMPPDRPEEPGTSRIPKSGKGDPKEWAKARSDFKAMMTKQFAGDMRRALISAWAARGDITYDMLATGLIDEDPRVQLATAKVILEGGHEELLADVMALCDEDERMKKVLGACGSDAEAP